MKLTYVASGACTVNPEVGLGTVVGSGANTTLGAVGATTEDIRDGGALGAFNGAVAVNYEGQLTIETDLLDGSTTPKDLFLNVAGNWATNVTLTYSGTVTLIWAVVND